jgi:hypothetical protein
MYIYIYASLLDSFFLLLHLDRSDRSGSIDMAKAKAPALLILCFLFLIALASAAEVSTLYALAARCICMDPQ